MIAIDAAGCARTPRDQPPFYGVKRIGVIMSSTIATRPTPATLAGKRASRTPLPSPVAVLTDEEVSAAAVAEVTANMTAIAQLRALVATVDSAASYAGPATASLIDGIRARYAAHAAKYARTLDGVSILTKDDAATVRALVWLDACERVTAPAAKDRTPAETSIGQNLSKLSTVAQDAVNGGTTKLGSTKELGDAYAAISTAKNGAKKLAEEKELAKLAYSAEVAYGKWLESLSGDDQLAFGRVIGQLTRDGFPHLDAFVADIRANLK